MKLRRIISYIYTDMINPRVALDAISGMATIMLAAAISILCISFTDSAFRLLEKAITPTRPVAGIVTVTARQGNFSTKDIKRLEDKLDQMISAKKIDAYSPIVASLDGDILPFRDVYGKQSPMLGLTVWFVPYGSLMLSEKLNFRFIKGVNFIKESTDTEKCKARLGILMNLKFLKIYMHYNDKHLEAIRNGDLKLLPDTIRLQFPAKPIDAGDGSLPKLPPATLVKISGVFDESSYPDLIITEDVVRAYYLGQYPDLERGLHGEFSLSYAFHFCQLESDEWLVNREGISIPELGYFPQTQEELESMVNYKSIRDSDYEPYNLFHVHVRNWKTEDAREKIRDELLDRNKLSVIKDNDSKELAEKLRLAAIGTIPGESNGSINEARSVLPDILAKHGVKLSMSGDFTVDIIGEMKGEKQQFLIEDRSQLRAFEIDFTDNNSTANVFELPPWKINLPSAKMTQALVRLRSIINTYGKVMFLIVFVLAASASLLLAFSHILRKIRDIGLLFTNGASPYNIFLIYLGEIILVAFCGWLLGIALAHGARPLIEGYASKTLQQFLASAEAQIGIGSARILSIDTLVIAKSFSWVLPAALIGAIFPVFRATKTDPLESLNKGV
ncbi:MAG: ABC transporter permease [Desulfamplus sp.]|nr:ABC transporter permease [Desulfamplus sp.]